MKINDLELYNARKRYGYRARVSIWIVRGKISRSAEMRLASHNHHVAIHARELREKRPGLPYLSAYRNTFRR